MKKLLFILPFFLNWFNDPMDLEVVTIAQVNMWTYDTGNGGNNNGVIDHFEHQNAVDNEADLIVDPATTLTVTSTMQYDQIAVQTIDYNGSTITRNSGVDWMQHVNHRFTPNAHTTISNLIVDGNNQSGKMVDIKSRVTFTNIEIKDCISDNCNGIRVLVYDSPGIYGDSTFDNVDIHNLESLNSDGSSGNNPGMVHGFLVSSQGNPPSSPTRIIYKNSELYELWGEDAGGITLNSPGRDTSNSNLSFWFENITVRDAQRRTVKNFIGNTTWINSRFISAANDNPKLVPGSAGGLNPAGLFVISSGSSATGATNNLICGCSFEGHPDDPDDSWYTQVIILGQNGPAGAEIRNSTITGGHGGRWNRNGFTAYTIPSDGGSLADITFQNTTIGAGNTIFVSNTNFNGTLTLDTNNTYVDGSSTVLAEVGPSYTELNIPFEACPSIGGITTDITGVHFQASNDRVHYIDENIVNPVFTLIPETTETGETYTYTKTGGGNDPTFFSLSGDQLTFDHTADYENPQDSNTNNIYALDILVTSTSGDTFTEDLALYINDVVGEGSDVPVSGIVWIDDEQTVGVNELLDLGHTFSPSNATDQGVTYSSTNLSVVDNTGTVVGIGECVLTITTDDGSFTDDMSVKVIARKRVGSLGNGKSIHVGGSGGQIFIGN
jgi:hypothetical protein